MFSCFHKVIVLLEYFDLFSQPYCTYLAASLAWPDPIPRRGVIAFSISAPLGKGSGTVHSVHSCNDQRMSLSVDWLHDWNKARAVLCVLKRMKL